MIVKNLNKSSEKTKRIIKATFAEMLSEKKELCRISVSELAARAGINRSTFYSHYDDVYAVAEDYENELIAQLSNKTAELGDLRQAEQFVDSFFGFIKVNDENYKLICKSDDSLYAANKLAESAEKRVLSYAFEKLVISDPKTFEIETDIFIQGLTWEYIKYCRGLTKISLDDIYEVARKWCAEFISNYKEKQL